MTHSTGHKAVVALLCSTLSLSAIACTTQNDSSGAASTATVSDTSTSETPRTELKTKKASKPKMTTASGLMIEDVKVGDGPAAKAGDTVTVHYVGTLTNGTKFDASRDHGQPFTFHLGGGEVIKGWDEGVAGMKVGGTRKLTVPPALGYGAQGTPDGSIPPNATLIFVVDLLKVG